MRDLTRTEVDQLIGRKGYLRSHVELGRDTAGGPDAYHFASALSVLAVALCNGESAYSAFLDPLQRLHPHHYRLTVGITGTGKTRSERIGQGILAEALPEAFLPQEWSKEALYDEMAKRPFGYMAHEEFKGLAAKMGREYNAGTMEFLTEAYDSPPLLRRKTKGGGEVEIRRPRITLVAGSTVEWFEQAIKDGDFEGGWLSRFIFFTARDVPALHRPAHRDAAAYQAVRRSLVEHVQAVAKLGGCADFQQVEDLAWPYLERRHAEIGSVSGPLRGFWSRIGVNVVKLAMLFHASECPDDLMIRPQAWARAVQLMEVMADTVHNLVTEQVTFTRTGKALNRLREMIRENNGADYRRLLQLSHLDAKTFNSLLGTLLQTEEAHRHEVSRRRGPAGSVIFEAERCLACTAKGNGHALGEAARVMEYETESVSE